MPPPVFSFSLSCSRCSLEWLWSKRWRRFPRPNFSSEPQDLCVNSVLRVTGCFADKPPSRFSDTTPVHRGRHPVAASLSTSSVSTSQSLWQVLWRDACRRFQKELCNVALCCADVPNVPQGGTTSSAAVFLRRHGLSMAREWWSHQWRSWLLNPSYPPSGLTVMLDGFPPHYLRWQLSTHQSWICNFFLPGFNFSSSGREDVDVRTLGDGNTIFLKKE